MEINEKIRKASDMIKGRVDGEFDKIYPFATENIGGYINQFDLENKSLCTVGSSLDQTFSAVLKGCTDITVLDICPFTKESLSLKLAALYSLDREEFMDFFCDESNFAFNDKIFFNKIYKQLMRIDYGSFMFWDRLFHKYNGKTIKQSLFEKNAITIKELQSFIPYLHDDYSYYMLRSNIMRANIKVINGDVLNIPSYRLEQFDNVFLSNIYDHLVLKKNINGLERFKIMVSFLKNQIKENGKVLVSYLYDTQRENKLGDNVFNKCNLKSFESVKSSYYKSKMLDSIITYQKK